MEKLDNQTVPVQERELESEKREANTIVALGAGVGALGVGAALVAGAVCPLCIFVAPGLVGVGLFKRWKLKMRKQKGRAHE